MILSSMARGVEDEYAMNTYPPDQLPRRTVVHTALNTLRTQGLVSSVGWSAADEVGNPEYERTLVRQWSLGEGPFPVAYNGMRVYDDAIHFEVGSPVYRDPLDAIVYAQVGEVFARRACRAASARLGVPVLAYHNNYSTRPISMAGEHAYESVAYGTHFNLALASRPEYLGAPERRWGALRQALMAYFVSRVLVCGAGDMLPVTRSKAGPSVTFVDGALRGREVAFAISPRVGFLRRTTSFDTTVDRGFVNTRDEPFADPRRYWRYHDINLEALRCPLHVYVRDALQVFVYGAFQAGLLDDAPRVRDPLRAALALSLDTEDMDWVVELEDGTRVDAARDLLLGYYVAKVEGWLARAGSPEDQAAFATVRRVTEKVANRDLEPLVWALDWVTKRQLLREYGVSGAEAVALCNQFSFVDDAVDTYVGETPGADVDTLFETEAAFATAARYLPAVDWAGWSSRVARGLHSGPADTRDYCRSVLLRRFESEMDRVSWDRVYLKTGEVLVFDDPLRFGEQDCGDAAARANSLASFHELMRKDARATRAQVGYKR